MTIIEAIPAAAWPWIWIVSAFALGWLAGWVHGDDHGRNQTNREWLESSSEHDRWAAKRFIKPEGNP
jgi:hypothetical protein